MLDDRCAGRPALRAEVEGLLASHGKAGGPLDRPAASRASAPSDPTAADYAGATVVGDPDAGGTSGGAGATIEEEEAAAPDFARKLGGYDILATVGRGGMGVVLKARDRHLDRIVAIKALAPELAADPTARRRFAREARAAAAVTHPHVVTIHAVEPDGPTPFLVMEYVAGRSLREKLDEEGALEVREVLRIGSQIAGGLAAAHGQGLIHRDVKPGNVLLENGVERVKLTDFGLARAVDDVAITRTGQIAGTPQFMSPEQAEGKPVDCRSDLFSLGSVLYAMCAGRPPFRGNSTVAVLRRVCDESPRPLREANPDVPPWLAEIIDRLLAKNPADRFDTAAEVAAVLGGRLAELQNPDAARPPLRSGPVPAFVAPPAGPRRGRWALAAATLAAVLLVGGTTEATGVTEVVPTIVRMVRGDGTLVLRTDDPHVGVTIEGEDVVLTGTGLSEIRLKPGTYKVKATKDGREFTELVTVRRNGREVVNVRWESANAGGGNAGGPPVAAGAHASRTLAGAETAGSAGSGELTPVRVLSGHAGVIRDLAFLPNGIEAASGGSDKTFRLWNVGIGLEIYRRDCPHWVSSVAISPDGSRAALGYITTRPTAEIEVIDLATKEQVHLLKGPPGLVHGLAYSPDGARLLAVGQKGVGRVFDAASGERLYEFRHGDDQVFSGEFAPDGRTFATCSNDVPQIVIRDAADGTAIQEIVAPEKAAVTAVRFSPDGTRLAAATTREMIPIFDAGSGAQLRVLPTPAAARDVRFLPDGRLASGSGDGGIRLWDPQTGAALAGRSTLTSGAQRLAVSPDGRALLSAGGDPRTLRRDDGDHALRLWRLPEPGTADVPQPDSPFTLVRELAGHASAVNAIAVYDGGRRAVSGSEEKRMRVWDVQTGALLKTIETGTAVKSVVVAADGRFAIVGTINPAEVRWYDLESGALDRRIGVPGDARDQFVSDLALTPDGSRVVAARLRGGPVVLDAATGRTIRTLDPPSRLSEAGPDVGSLCLALSPDGARAATGWHSSGRDGEIVVWDLDSGEVLVQQDVGSSAAMDLAFSPDGTRLLTGDSGGRLTLLDAADGAILRRFRGHDDAVSAVAFLPDGARALTGGLDDVLTLWETASGAELARLRRPDKTLLHATLLPDGRRVLTGGGGFWDGERAVRTGDYALRLWELPGEDAPAEAAEPAGSPAEALPGLIEDVRIEELADFILALAFSPDGTRLVTGGSSSGAGGAIVWDSRNGRRKRALDGHDGHSVDAAVVLPDGERVVTAGRQDAIILSDLSTGEVLRRFVGHTGFVACLAVSSDGSRIASGSSNWVRKDRGDLTVRVWDAETGKELWRADMPPTGNGYGAVHDVTFTPDGSRVVSVHHAAEDGISVWDAATGELEKRFSGPHSSIKSAALSPDGRTLATGHEAVQVKERRWDDPENAVVRLWDLERGELTRRFIGHAGQINAVAFSPDGARLLSCSGSQFLNDDWTPEPSRDNTLRLWDVETGAELARQHLSGGGQAAAFAPDGARVVSATGGTNLWVQIWRTPAR
ncbi:Serine/threonine-protein kinase PknD [Planctomycetes bacterium LzC2]|uniref:Serine/threonine-protein kinase PknD n=1 Tax=Alienimonas chondri TaxID=2681879 RepID=A0ABX1VKM3_9PLAN|nr:Serine/threonine-protein kinase PknD [Alienimonas chondri]